MFVPVADADAPAAAVAVRVPESGLHAQHALLLILTPPSVLCPWDLLIVLTIQAYVPHTFV